MIEHINKKPMPQTCNGDTSSVDQKKDTRRNIPHVVHQSWQSRMEQLEASVSETYEKTTVQNN